MHFAALQLIDPRVRVRDEREHQPANARILIAAPVVRHSLEQDVLAAFPFGHPIGPRPERAAIVV